VVGDCNLIATKHGRCGKYVLSYNYAEASRVRSAECLVDV